MNNKERAAFNTAVVYIRLLITTLINLYLARAVLLALGVEDFGIYSLVGSVVSMLSFLSSSMSVSTQRFLSFHLGKKDYEIQNVIFSSSFFLHIVLGLIIITILLVVMPLIFNSSIQIPESRIEIAQWVYIIMVGGTFCTIIAVPYEATLTAHENFLFISILTVAINLIKLVFVVLLPFIPFDKLVIYALIIFLTQFLTLIAEWLYSKRKYSESHFNRFNIKKDTVKQLTSFTVWNTFGGLAVVGRSQGLSVVINIFSGVISNAAYGLANQISGALRSLAMGVQSALNPQIMKNEGAGEHTGMAKLALLQSKYTYLILILLALPLYIDMPYVLEIWLKEVPPDAVVYCRLILVIVSIQQVSSGLPVAIQAVGNIKSYQITISTIILFTVVLAYIFLKMGYPGYYALVASVIIEIVCLIVRPFFGARYGGVSIKSFITVVLLPCIIITTVSAIASGFFYNIFKLSGRFGGLLALVFISTFTIIIASYFTMSKYERQVFGGFFKRLKNNKNLQ